MNSGKTNLPNNELREKFLHNITHELRTPLNGVLGYSEILLENSNLDENQTKHIEKIIQCGEHLLDLINNIIEVSKLENNTRTIKRSLFSLRNLLDKLEEFAFIKKDNKDLDVIIDIDENLPDQVIGDRKFLINILTNLVSNAVKFTEKGFIKISIERIEEDIFKFSVEDTGKGISPEKIEKLKNIQNYNNEIAYEAEGVGLGIAIISKLLKMLDSELNIESKIEEGSNFWFNLKLELTSKEDKIFYNESIEKLFNKKKILFVDDNYGNRRLNINVFKNIDIEVLEASDGFSAIKVAKKENPDYIFMDMKMPGMDGIEASQKISSMNEINPLIILVTSFEKEYFEQEVEIDSVAGIISKPFSISSLEFILKNKNNKISEKKKNVRLSEIKLPSTRKIEEINYLVKRGDLSNLLDKVEDFEKENNYHGEFYNRLKKLINNYKIKEIHELVSKSLNKARLNE